MIDNTDQLAFLNEISDYFGLGGVAFYSHVEDGRNSHNYHILMQDSREFVVRILHNFNSIRLQNEIVLQRALKDTGVYSVSLEMSGNGSYIFKNKNTLITVAGFIPGKHPDESSSLNDIKLIGETLGSFHTKVDSALNLDNRYLFVGNTRRNERLWRLSLQHKAKVVDLFLRVSLIEGRRDLPSGVLHGDLHAKNIIIHQSGRAYMLDFQSVGIGPYILDIGRSMADICRSGTEIDIERVKAFLEGYTSKRSLSLLEKSLISESIAFGAGCIALWAYEKDVEKLGDDMIALANSLVGSSPKGFNFL